MISSAVEHCLHTAGVTCSIHVSPTKFKSALQHCKALFSLCLHRDTLACSGQGQVAGTMIKRLSQNHAFLDGNKRIAFAAVYAFLRINGCRTTVDNDCAETFIADLYERNDLRFETLRDWLKANTEEASF